MLLYRIILVLLTKELRYADSTLLLPFYSGYVAFDGSSKRSATQLRLLMDQGLDWGYLPEPAKLLFISVNLEDKEAARREFERSGLNINYLDGRQYLGAYWVPRGGLYK